MPIMKAWVLLAVAITMQTGPLVAQTAGVPHGMDHGGSDHGGMDMPRSGTPFAEAMDAMMKEMDAVDPTGDADADFLLMMIPHHQSAVDMARTLIEQSDDDEVTALARTIMETQQAEIAAMKGMLVRLRDPKE